MHGASKELKAREMSAVAASLESLGGA